MQNWPDFRLRRACTLFQAGLGKAVVLHPTPYQVQTLPPGPPGWAEHSEAPISWVHVEQENIPCLPLLNIFNKKWFPFLVPTIVISVITAVEQQGPSPGLSRSPRALHCRWAQAPAAFCSGRSTSGSPQPFLGSHLSAVVFVEQNHVGTSPVMMGLRIAATTTKRYSSGPAPSGPMGMQPLAFLSDHPENPLK